ncbi:MAG: hypothetical protein MR902_00960 [Campylobacter sp.]|nr:hypothetical protein [Campylobacter sp.]
MSYKPKLQKEFLYPLEYGLEIFGDKWKSHIICVLATKDSYRSTMNSKKS